MYRFFLIPRFPFTRRILAPEYFEENKSSPSHRGRPNAIYIIILYYMPVRMKSRARETVYETRSCCYRAILHVRLKSKRVPGIPLIYFGELWLGLTRGPNGPRWLWWWLQCWLDDHNLSSLHIHRTYFPNTPSVLLENTERKKL